MDLILPDEFKNEVRGYIIHKVPNFEDLVTIKFYRDTDRKELFCEIMLDAQKFTGFAGLITKFINAHPGIIRNTNPPQDLGKLTSGDEFPAS